MTQIADDSIAAFCEGRKFKRSNMRVVVCPDDVGLFQHGHMIAYRPRHVGLYKTQISNCGYFTPTTKERLTKLLWRITQGAWSLYQHNWEWILHSHTHGESLPFHGSVDIETLVDLDETIIKERIARGQSS